MKKLFAALAFIIAAVLAVPPVAAAEIPDETLGVYSVITDKDGSEQIAGAPDVDRVEESQEYNLYVGSKEALSVGASGSSDKRFHVEFMLPGTTKQVYLTGLCAENVDDIQQEILANYIDNQPFDFEDLNFIDAEKLKPEQSDTYLCWAASCANMLTYTGWAQKAGFKNEDEVFDLYNKSFSNNGGFQYYGLAWFFNGVALGNNSGYYSTKILNYPNSGAYFKNYAYDMVCDYEDIKGVTQLNHMEERLREGCAVSPGIGIAYDGEVGGGHAITLWGFMTDTSLEKNNINRFLQVFITDSDSDMTEPYDRTLSDNVMNMKPVYADGNGQLWFDYDEHTSAVFQDFAYLLPYKSSVPREREIVTMRDKTKYPDIGFGHVTLSETKYEQEQVLLHESGTKLYFGLEVSNASDRDYRAAINVSRNIVNENGKTVLNDSVNLARTRLNYAERTEMYYSELSKLPAGDYKITLKVNENRPVTEAYYYNNTYTLNFKMRDSYISGDSNKDKKITIGDVTKIQQILAGIDADDKAAERGNIIDGELDVNDATLLQKYIANFDVDAPIGEKRLHTVI
ncbi:MAG: dockerin type I repeat-containing protein [Ruminococcus sp.]|nr:dockerin type I repeat-containing protein [Ruminococcus sp.]